MENKNKDLINEQEQVVEQETEIREEEELEFISSDVDVKDYSVPTDAPAEAENRPEESLERMTAVEEKSDAPAEEAEETEDEDDSDSTEATPGYLVRLVLTLAGICMVIALLLALVNNITKDRIAENIAKQQETAILSIFPDGTETEEYTNADGETVYIVHKDGEAIGYCVNSFGTGFGGQVQVMVGFNADKSVRGIKIVSMSETPGIGTKVQGDSFLGQFLGIDNTDDVDIISGATFSSKAVIEAVNNAIEVEFDLEKPQADEQENEPVDGAEIITRKDYVDTVNVPVVSAPVITDSTVVYTVEAPERENESPWEGFVPNTGTQE